MLLQFQAPLLSEQDEQLQDIASLEVSRELRAVLDSPLPEGLASPPPAQDESPGFAYPTPPASHEGASFVVTSHAAASMLDEPPQASSPLSAAFFTSTMSSAAAVEEALEEVLPGESLSPDDMYPSLSNSPPPQPPAGGSPGPAAGSAGPEAEPASHVATGDLARFSLTHMMPNSEDPLLSSSPKDFSARKRFDFASVHSLKIVGNAGLIDFGSPNLAGILVDSNGELKFIQTSAGGAPTHIHAAGKNIIVTAAAATAHAPSPQETHAVHTAAAAAATPPTNKPQHRRPVVADGTHEESVFLSPSM